MYTLGPLYCVRTGLPLRYRCRLVERRLTVARYVKEVAHAFRLFQIEEIVLIGRWRRQPQQWSEA